MLISPDCECFIAQKILFIKAGKVKTGRQTR